MYGHVYRMSVDRTSCRILVWGGVDIIQRKTGLLAHKVTITERGNFPMSHHWIIFVWVRVPAASPSFGLMTHWTCCTSNFMGVIKKQIIFFITLDSTLENIFFNIPCNNIYVNISMQCFLVCVCGCVSVCVLLHVRLCCVQSLKVSLEFLSSLVTSIHTYTIYIHSKLNKMI